MSELCYRCSIDKECPYCAYKIYLNDEELSKGVHINPTKININKILKFFNIMIIKIQSTSNNDTCKTHKECLDKINSMEEMIKYINTLKCENGLNTDITSDSKVKVFNSTKN